MPSSRRGGRWGRQFIHRNTTAKETAMTRRNAIVPTTRRHHDAARRPFGLPRRQRAATAVASVVVSCVLLSMVALGMAGAPELPPRVADGAAVVNAA
jgi:hypothetical protein